MYEHKHYIFLIYYFTNVIFVFISCDTFHLQFYTVYMYNIIVTPVFLSFIFPWFIFFYSFIIGFLSSFVLNISLLENIVLDIFRNWISASLTFNFSPFTFIIINRKTYFIFLIFHASFIYIWSFLHSIGLSKKILHLIWKLHFTFLFFGGYSEFNTKFPIFLPQPLHMVI